MKGTFNINTFFSPFSRYVFISQWGSQKKENTGSRDVMMIGNSIKGKKESNHGSWHGNNGDLETFFRLDRSDEEANQ